MSAFCTGQAHNLCSVKKLSAAKKPGAKGYPPATHCNRLLNAGAIAQAGVHAVKNIAIVRVDLPGEQAT